MKVILATIFLLKLVSAKEIPAEPEVQEIMPETNLMNLPMFSRETIQDKVDQMATEAMYESIVKMIEQYTKAPYESMTKAGNQAYTEMTRVGGEVVKFGREAAPYAVAITIVVGVFYFIVSMVNLVFNTKASVMRLASDYVNNNMNIFKTEVPQLMQRMMPDFNILDAIEKMTQKYE